MHTLYRSLPLLLAAALSACTLAADSFGSFAALDADSKSHKCIEALAAHDKARLLAIGISEPLADKIIADAAGRVASKDATYVNEDFNGDEYWRQYTVARTKNAPTDPATIDIRLWFTKATSDFTKDYAHLKFVEFIEEKTNPVLQP
jgi:hypothetical protein